MHGCVQGQLWWPQLSVQSWVSPVRTDLHASLHFLGHHTVPFSSSLFNHGFLLLFQLKGKYTLEGISVASVLVIVTDASCGMTMR